MKAYFLFIVMLIIANSYAQLQHTFTQTARNTHYGVTIDAVVDSNGTVFIANGVGGLHAYNYDGVSFTNTAHINDGGNAVGVAVSSNGTVFLATDDDGLRAYSYDGVSFTNTAHIDDSPWGTSVAVGSDGTIFLANFSSGLMAYTYSGYTTNVKNDFSKIPVNYQLLQNYPNPFNPTTMISYQLPKSSEVELSIYNNLGQKVATLVNKKQAVGTYSLQWNASGFSSGVYFYILNAGEFKQVRKMIFLK